MRSTKSILKPRSKQYYLYLFLTASMEGVGVIVLGVVLELLLMLGVLTGFIKEGMEWFIISSLSIIGFSLILIRSIQLWLKLRRHNGV